MAQEPLTSFVGRDAAYQLGYLSGASAASYGIGISEEQRAIVAVAQYNHMSRILVLNRDTWLDGWVQGYKEFTTPIVIVICAVQEG